MAFEDLTWEDLELWETFFASLGSNPNLKFRFIHGEDDDSVPFEESAEFAAALEEAGYDVELIPFSGGHTVPFELTAQTVLELTRD